MTQTELSIMLSVEARCLGFRWRVKPAAVKKWMVARGMTSTMDFRDRWPGSWAESNDAALSDFWDYHWPAGSDIPLTKSASQ